jgi:peptide/nickel transport system permease protein
MVAEGASQAMAGNWWLVVFPGLALALAVFAFNLLGDALRDILDVRSR